MAELVAARLSLGEMGAEARSRARDLSSAASGGSGALSAREVEEATMAEVARAIRRVEGGGEGAEAARRELAKLAEAGWGRRRAVGGRTALMVAAAFDLDVECRALGSAVEPLFDDAGRSALMIAIESGHARWARRLLGAGAGPTLSSPLDGATALMLAAERGQAALLGEMLQMGDDRGPRKVDVHGRSAVGRALAAGHRVCARLAAVASGMDAGQIWELMGAEGLALKAKEARGRLAVLSSPAPAQAGDLGRRLAASRGARRQEPGAPERAPRG